ncbi:MAG TPA: 50S ribosomal protein L23 [Syntrophales bacterium]|nr:50S ribosomal protein L23 [Syntrophales bacterium]
MELYSIIRRPLLTEKSTISREQSNQYVFEVAPGSTKIEIQNAVEKLFKVKVLSVRTVNMQGKKKRMGRIMGRRRNWKKATVKLAPGDTIDIFSEV